MQEYELQLIIDIFFFLSISGIPFPSNKWKFCGDNYNQKMNKLESPTVYWNYVESILLSRVLRDSTPRYVGPSVGQSVGWSVGRSPFYFFGVF